MNVFSISKAIALVLKHKLRELILLNYEHKTLIWEQIEF